MSSVELFPRKLLCRNYTWVFIMFIAFYVNANLYSSSSYGCLRTGSWYEPVYYQRETRLYLLAFYTQCSIVWIYMVYKRVIQKFNCILSLFKVLFIHHTFVLTVDTRKAIFKTAMLWSREYKVDPRWVKWS